MDLGDSSAVLGQYTAGATLTDSLADREITGASAIPHGGGRTLRPLAAWGHTARVPRRRGEAAFISGRYGAGIGGTDRLVLLLDVPGEGECPGAVAVVLWLDLKAAQRITREERLHRIDALRRCTTPDKRPGGWWESIRPPTTQPIIRTGTLNPGRHDIAIWNGDPRIDPIIDWARQRFALRGLPPPQLMSVTFLPPGGR